MRDPLWRAIYGAPEPVDPLRRTQVHEAAHAVACIRFGGDLVHVKVGRDDRVEGAGHAAMRSGSMTPEQDAVTDLSGRAAEAFLFYRELEYESAAECFESITEKYEEDHINASVTIHQIFGNEDEDSSVHDARMKRLYSITLEWVSENITDIVKVADALAVTPLMTGEDVSKLLGA